MSTRPHTAPIEVLKQNKNTPFIDVFDSHSDELIDEFGQLPQRVILVAEYEEAYDLWLFRYNYKVGAWLFAGIYQNGVFNKLNKQGYFKRYSPDGKSFFFLLDEGNLVSEVIPAQMRDSIKAYVDANKGTIATESYEVTHAARSERLTRTSNSLFNDKTLVVLPTHDRPFLRDDAQTCYLPFRNGIVKVTKDRVELMPYSMLNDVCIWKSQIIDRDFNPDASTNCHFAQFINNVTNNELDREQAFRTAIGYTIHAYNSQTEGQAIICCDEELTDKSRPQGGTGKGLLVTAIKQMRPVAYIDGKKFDPDSQFCFQVVNRDTRVVWLDDVKSDFSFERFFSVLTTGWTIEKKNQTAYTIPQVEGPKLIICTNTAPNNEGTSNARRQFILEFSNFYSQRIKADKKAYPIRDVHGCEFFSQEWDSQEWDSFDRYMVNCVQQYLQSGLQPYQPHNVSANRLLQTTSEEFCTWVASYDEKGLQANQVYNKNSLLENFRRFAGLSEHEMPSRRFTNWIKRFAEGKGWTFQLGPSNNTPTFILHRKP